MTESRSPLGSSYQHLDQPSDGLQLPLLHALEDGGLNSFPSPEDQAGLSRIRAFNRWLSASSLIPASLFPRLL